MTRSSDKPNVAAAITRYRQHASGYDASALRTMRMRLQTIERLALRPGDRVLDVACGTGLSFPWLRKAVGVNGEVVGIDVSPEMLGLARRRVDEAGWRNVSLLQSSADTAELPGPFDALLFHFTHDVLRSPTALDRIFSAVGLDARVDLAGMKYPPRWMAPLNPLVRARARPYMTTLHPWHKGKHLLAVKGSPEQVLAMCEKQIRNGRVIELDAGTRDAIMIQNERMAGDALRVLGVAYRELDEARMPGKTSRLIWLGLAGMADPIREGMDRLIAQFHEAGIKTVMITGDQAATAQAIGRQLGLSGDEPLQVLESSKLEDVEPELLAGLVKNVHVFARVSPAHKLRIVQAFQGAGMVVAMTGDGINDGPALKAADIGVAMGESGTNVARDVSDVVLEDDNLHTMAIAVNQGRTIYNNIRKMIHFMVSTNLTEIEVMLAGIASGMGQPMNSMQLLWINLVTDIFPGLALSMEPPEPGIMSRDPRDPDEPIIAGPDLKRMLFESGTIGLGVMGYPMAGHLARVGYPVTVYNRTRARAEAWVAERLARARDAPTATEGAELGAAISFALGRGWSGSRPLAPRHSGSWS